ncbi:MAG: hypothetical protein ISS90_02065, partial [Candidatus Omnitrophica bacterium]|nr:hypothetical protein [Candidatus Omnitrophota bacterium]
TVVYCKGENLASNLRGRISGGTLNSKSDIVIAVTTQEGTYEALTGKDEDQKQESFNKENVFVTETKASPTYVPLVEAVYFSLARMLAYHGRRDKKVVWECYNKIPYREEMDFAEFEKAYFDGDKPKLSVFLNLNPPKKFSGDLDQLSKNIAQILRDA